MPPLHAQSQRPLGRWRADCAFISVIVSNALESGNEHNANFQHDFIPKFSLCQTRMQSLQPEPAARYKNVMDALHRIVATEGVWRPMRGLNATAVGAGPAHALYFACYEKLKRTLSDVIHPGANSHLANGITKYAFAHIIYILTHKHIHRQVVAWRSCSHSQICRSSSTVEHPCVPPQKLLTQPKLDITVSLGSLKLASNSNNPTLREY